jgi:hypothetical protein
MYNPTMRFSSENRLFSYAFAALVTLSSLPVLSWHYWQSLDGVAVLALIGLALADLVLWQSTHWSVLAHVPAIKATALIAKIALSLVMLINAGVVVILIRDARSVEDREQACLVELRERISGAERLAAAGARSAAREIAKSTPEAGASASTSSRILAWYREIGVYCLPPVAGLIVFFALSIVAALAGRREYLGELVFDERPRSMEMISSREIDARPM